MRFEFSYLVLMKRAARIFGIAVLAALAVPGFSQNTGQALSLLSGGRSYASYISAGAGASRKPAIILIHSFNGLEQGYRDLVDKFAAEGFVVLAVGWQTFEKSPSDAVVEQIVRDAIVVLKARADVDPTRLGLTGFCAGGRYTMLLLPTVTDFAAGVAWYGFPNAGGSAAQPVKPIDEIPQLQHPLLMIHGSADQASPIAGIFQYASALQGAGKYFELKVYQGLPHGFMVQNGQLWRNDKADDAFQQMVSFFRRMM
jgi:carboxymethylenebutenolidase